MTTTTPSLTGQKAPSPRTLTVALIGNPNTGKSTLFNALAGMHARVGNYPGVTVEKKIGRLRNGDTTLQLVDLPGTYSLAARSPDEMVSVEVLLGRQPDVGRLDAVACIVDASNLERNLFLVSQVLDVGLPTVLILNMSDVARQRGTTIDVPALSKRLGIPVVTTEAHRRVGIEEVRRAILEAAESGRSAATPALSRSFYEEVAELARDLRVVNGDAVPRYMVERLLLDPNGQIEKWLTPSQPAGFTERLARAGGVPEGVVLADAGYGINTAFRAALMGMGLTYVVGVQSSVRLWPPGVGRLPPKAWTGQGRPPTLMRRDTQNQPQSAKQLAKSLPADAWRDVAWREGVDKTLRSRFAAVRVRPAHRDYWRSHPYAEEWLLVEWPQSESAPTKYWLSTLPADTALATLVETAKLRWRIERDYQELKQELGLDHFEGRGWRGFHHHMALCVAAYGFLVSERSPIPPSDDKIPLIKTSGLSDGFRRRGSPDPHRTPRQIVHL